MVREWFESWNDDHSHSLPAATIAGFLTLTLGIGLIMVFQQFLIEEFGIGLISNPIESLAILGTTILIIAGGLMLCTLVGMAIVSLIEQ